MTDLLAAYNHVLMRASPTLMIGIAQRVLGKSTMAEYTIPGSIVKTNILRRSYARSFNSKAGPQKNSGHHTRVFSLPVVIYTVLLRGSTASVMEVP